MPIGPGHLAYGDDVREFPGIHPGVVVHDFALDERKHSAAAAEPEQPYLEERGEEGEVDAHLPFLRACRRSIRRFPR